MVKMSPRQWSGPAVRPGYWFRPKRVGYGAAPATWQGWLATAAMVAIAALIANAASHGHPDFIVLLVPVVLGFVWLCKVKTDGEWRWRKGGEE